MKSLEELAAIKEKMKNQVAIREGSAKMRVVVGMATRGPKDTPVRTAWDQGQAGWRVLYSAPRGEKYSRVGPLSSDGRLAYAHHGYADPALWNLVNNRLLKMSQVVAGLDVVVGAAGMELDRSSIVGFAYDAASNSYTVLGGASDGEWQKSWVITHYAPFLTRGRPLVGALVDAPLPEAGGARYRVGPLPPGLRYDPVDRRISGRVTQAGLFKVRIRNLDTGRARESILRVRPFAVEQRGVRTIELAPAGEAEGSGHLRLRIGKTGGVVGHLTWPAGTGRITFSGVMVPDEGEDEARLRLNRRTEDSGRLLSRGKGARREVFRLELVLTREGDVFAQLFDSADALLGEGGASAH